MEKPMDLDGLTEAQCQQLLGWLQATLRGGQVVDAGEWNRAITAVTSRTA